MKYELIKPEYTELIDSLVNVGALRRIVDTEIIPDIYKHIAETSARRVFNEDKERMMAFNPILAAPYGDPAAQIGGHIEYNLYDRPASPFDKISGGTTIAVGIPRKPIDPIPSGADLYLNNGKAIEHNLEEISRTAFGFVEEKKLWAKELKLAVKEHGHDEVLSGFYNWCENNSNFKGTKPVGLFLKNVASNIGFVRKAPGFSNPNLDYVIKEIGYLTDNKVMFWGNTRAVLAKSIQEHGVENVLEAWRKFYNEDDNPSFAANGFISQIDILVYNVNKRKKEAANAQLAIEAAYRDAQATVQTEPEEELEEL